VDYFGVKLHSVSVILMILHGSDDNATGSGNLETGRYFLDIITVTHPGCGWAFNLPEE
jgi:hypothetical protein